MQARRAHHLLERILFVVIACTLVFAGLCIYSCLVGIYEDRWVSASARWAPNCAQLTHTVLLATPCCTPSSDSQTVVRHIMRLPRSMDTHRTITPCPRAAPSLPISRLVLAACRMQLGPRDVRPVIAGQTRLRHRVLWCAAYSCCCCLRHRGRGRGVLRIGGGAADGDEDGMRTAAESGSRTRHWNRHLCEWLSFSFLSAACGVCVR